MEYVINIINEQTCNKILIHYTINKFEIFSDYKQNVQFQRHKTYEISHNPNQVITLVSFKKSNFVIINLILRNVGSN